MISDLFFIISAFLGTYKCFQIYEANGGRLYVTDALKLYARKYLRVAPMLYLVFFFGWSTASRLNESPTWINYQQLFYECDKYWWGQVLMIGNFTPFWTEMNQGCFYWAWTIYVDF